MHTRKEELQMFLKENPNDVFLNYALGLEFISENNLKEAQLQFEKVIGIDNTYIPAYYQLGMIYHQQNKTSDALEILNKGLILAKQNKKTKEQAEFLSAITNIENNLL